MLHLYDLLAIVVVCCFLLLIVHPGRFRTKGKSAKAPGNWITKRPM